jgi:serine/threonine protein kinase
MTSPSTEDPTRPVLPGVDVGLPLGRGGFASVYRGRHRALDTDVAVKIVNTEGEDARAIEKALDEARLLARLDHPNLLRIYDAGRLGTSIYLVLELMDGGSLLGIRRASAEMLTDLAQQLLSGLQAMHEARVLHRDVKPANCLVRQRDRRVKLADLGIAIEQAATVQTSQNVAGTLRSWLPSCLIGRLATAPARTSMPSG